MTEGIPVNIEKHQLELLVKGSKTAKFSIQRSDQAGGWILRGTINHQSFFLVKQNGGYRVWKSLDTLISFLDSLGSKVGSLQTELYV